MSRRPRHPRPPTGKRVVALLPLVALLVFCVAIGAAAPSALLTDHGGRVLATPQVSAIYLGSFWATDPGASERIHTDAFLGTWLAGPSITDVLAQYRVTSATLAPSINVSVPSPSQFTDAEVQTLVQQQIAANAVVAGPEVVHVVYLPQGTVLTFQGVDSLHGLGGYHSSFIDAAGAPVYYAVVVYNQTIGQDVNGIDLTGTPQDNATIITSRVLSGAFTDPDINVSFKGWFDDANNGEVGDIAFILSQDPAHQDVFTVQNAFDVVLLWSNKDQKLTAGGGTTTSTTLLVTPAAQTATPGGTATYTVLNPTAETLTLAVSGLPTGATGTLAATSLAPGVSTTLTVTVAADAALTTALFTVTGTGATTAPSATATLTISSSTSQPPATAAADFSVTVTPTAQDMVRGAPAAVYTITTTAAGSGTVRLKLKTQHVLGGLKAYLSTTRMVAGDSATVAIIAKRDTRRKTYDFTLKISSDQADQRVPLTLTLR